VLYFYNDEQDRKILNIFNTLFHKIENWTNHVLHEFIALLGMTVGYWRHIYDKLSFLSLLKL